MNLTDKEKEICNQYSKRDENGLVHCKECPLAIHPPMQNGYFCGVCYANIDGRIKEAKELKRYE